MKLLHTADWHVGKTVRGRSRADEHAAVLAEVAAIADAEDVDVVAVVGDVFDTAAPAPESERIVYRALLDLSAHGERPVVVVAGNHDNARRLGAVSPVFDLANVHVASTVRAPTGGGVLELTTRAGEPVRLALLPFLGQRHVVHAADLMALDATETGGHYAARLAQIIGALTAGFTPDAVNVVLAHLMVSGGVLGGGERSAHTIFDYWVAGNAFPSSAHYVALGHLHRPQRIEGPCPLWYSGSPLAMDFGEEDDAKAVLIVEATPSTPAAVRSVPLAAGRRFRTIRGTLAELTARAAVGAEASPAEVSPVEDADEQPTLFAADGSTSAAASSVADADADVDDAPEAGDAPAAATAADAPTGDFLRVVVRERPRPGLADEVRALFPDAIDIKVEVPRGHDEPVAAAGDTGDRSPHDLFVQYLAAKGSDDARVVALFDEIFDQIVDHDGEREAEPDGSSDAHPVGRGAGRAT